MQQQQQQQQQTVPPYFDPLSPNTAALLDSISMGEFASKQTVTPATFAPAALFPIPGRDTPEDSSPDSVNLNNSNDQSQAQVISDDSDSELHGVNEVINHKRKASRTHEVDHDVDDPDDSLSDNGHEDKKQQLNDAKGTRTARRKSGDGKPKATDKSGKPEQSNKAQRRKEQNRAAQKAFRERREAKVRDLEAKVAELEAKSFGTSVENENLRSIVKRLQEENIALKEAQFTFTMPMNGAAHSVNGQQTPTPSRNLQQANAIDWSQFASFNNASIGKPPSPPQSVSNDSLRSVHDNNSPPLQVHRASSSSANDSQEGPSPPDANSVPSLFGPRGANGNTGFDASKRPVIGASPNDQLSTPSSIGTNKDDVEALFRSLYPNGIPNGSSIDSVLAGTAGSNTANPHVAQQQAHSPYTFLSAQPGLTSFADSSSNMMAKLFEPNSYRDSSSKQETAAAPSGPTTTSTAVPGGSLTSSPTWADLVSSNQADFLASLSSNANDASEAGPEDDAFLKQLEQLIQSGSIPFNSATGQAAQPFSPTNYLNMSPSPLQSLSNSQTPRSATESSDNLQSPRSDGQPTCGPSRIVHVVGDDGRVMRPSEVWTKMGLNSVSEPQDLLIDDLCDQFKGKATCKDGKRYMSYSDLVDMQYARDRLGEPPLMADSAAKPSPSELKESECEEHDPSECQAKANELFLQAKHPQPAA